jgi:predicted nucleotidyltransferase
VTDFRSLLAALAGTKTEFLIVGGVAAIAHGSARLTADLDIVYRRTSDNFHRLASALKDLAPYLRGAPPGLPFRWDGETVAKGLNFTLITSLGELDLLGEITGGGGYDELLPHTIVLDLFGIECRCLGLKRLIEVKRAAGRPKDLEVIAELEAIREETD